MCHSLLLGLVLGFLASRLFIGLRRLRGGAGLGGCGGWQRQHQCHRGQHHHHHPMAMGAFFTRFTAPGKSIEELAGALDLNGLQQQQAVPVLSKLREHLGARGPHLEAALGVVAGESFDRQRGQDLLAHPSLAVPPDAARELLDGLEHLHNILIPEQREALRGQLSK